MKFTKMHGIGNDYVYLNGFEQAIDHPGDVARAVADRHFGIGGDGLILILPSVAGDVRMRMFNADGSEAEMCGNGVRCVAKYAFDHGLTRSNPMNVETGNGVLSLQLHLKDSVVDKVTVNMGKPILSPGDIPVALPNYAGDTVIEQNIALLGIGQLQTLDIDPIFSCVSMGNPHVVIYCDDVASIDLPTIGPMIENADVFPNRINVHFVQVVSPNELIMRTWERGTGITLACGTGACAVAVAGVLGNRNARQVTAHLPGGDLQLDWNESDQSVYMTGEAREVFSGEWQPR